MSSSSSSLILLAMLAATASATDGLDAESLVQLEIGKHNHSSKGRANQPGDACTCLNWRDVYDQHRIECGEGQELTWAGGMAAKPFLGEEFCTNFYTKVSGNFCTQRFFAQPSNEQWCYVSSACQNLNGADGTVPTSAGIKWKACVDGVDQTLRSMQPEAVLALALQENKDAGLMMKMAYPVADKKAENGLAWPDIKATVLQDEYEKDALVKAKLQELAESGSPMVFDSLDGHPPFGVVISGGGPIPKIFESHFTPWFYDHVRRSDMSQNMGQMNTYECIFGCDTDLELKDGDEK